MRTNPPIHARQWLTESRLAVQVLLALFLVATVAAQGPPAEPRVQGDGNLKVMTYNVYAGTGYAGATDPNLAVFLQAMTNAVLDIRASDPAGRAQAVARQIAATKPHIVSLQEVFTMSTGPSKDNLTLEFDYLQLLLQALAEQGAYYTPVQSVTTWDAMVPTTFGYTRNTWRIVILARADLKPEHFHLTNVDWKLFSTTITYPLAALNGSADCPEVLQPSGACVMRWPRGWALADVSYRGKQFRYVNATLESRSASRNIAQGIELLNGPLNTALPVILAGDLNCDLSNLSDPKRVTCVRFIEAGFVDAWGAAEPSEPGFTKELPTMTMRGDYVMLRGLFHAEAAALVGEDPVDKTASGLWPSNHAGVVVKLDRPESE
jgi:endonuclease/exonuclease/phosphatase family metal-dependent hydrolase